MENSTILICVIASELITLCQSVIAIFLNNRLADRHYCAQRNFASTFVPLILFYNWVQLVRTQQKLHHISVLARCTFHEADPQ